MNRDVVVPVLHVRDPSQLEQLTLEDDRWWELSMFQLVLVNIWAFDNKQPGCLRSSKVGQMNGILAGVASLPVNFFRKIPREVGSIK